MSECVVRMEIPDRCGACRCRHVEFDIDYVSVFCSLKDNEYVEDPDSRPSWCPIICQLPEGHGRLVDADKLADDMKARKAFFGRKSDPQCLVEDAPTIVPAEGANK